MSRLTLGPLDPDGPLDRPVAGPAPAGPAPAGPLDRPPAIEPAGAEAGPAALPLGRRIQTLLYTAPLHELEANKAYRGEWLAPYDLRTLQLEALWTVIRGQGLDAGVARPAVVAAVARCAAEMAPEAGRRQQAEVAEIVVGWLLNEQAAESGFRYDYVDRTPDGRLARRGYDVVLLRERQQPDGSLLLLASPGAINLFIGALDVDVADAQRADELLLQEYIASGRFDAAEQQAQRAYLRSKQYAELVRHWLHLAQQDIRMLDWSGAIAATMDEARGHVAARLEQEAQMRFRLDEHRAEIEDVDRLRTIARLAELIDDCQRRHTQLHSLLMRAGDVFLAEQQRQRLAPPPAIHLVSPNADLLLPTLALRPREALEVVGRFVTGLAGPRSPELVDLFYLVDDLLAPRREFSEEELYADPVVLDGGDEPARFGPAVVSAARGLLASAVERPARLGALLAASRRRGLETAGRGRGVGPGGGPEVAGGAAAAVGGPDAGGDVGELLRLGALWAFAPEDDSDEALGPAGLLAVDDGRALYDPAFAGADLLLGTAEALRDAASAAAESAAGESPGRPPAAGLSGGGAAFGEAARAAPSGTDQAGSAGEPARGPSGGAG